MSELASLLAITVLMVVSIVLWRRVTVEFLRTHSQDQPFLYPTMLVDMVVDCFKAIRLAIRMQCALPFGVIVQLILMMSLSIVLAMYIKAAA